MSYFSGRVSENLNEIRRLALMSALEVAKERDLDQLMALSANIVGIAYELMFGPTIEGNAASPDQLDEMWSKITDAGKKFALEWIKERKNEAGNA